jgi:hypothetical protein
MKKPILWVISNLIFIFEFIILECQAGTIWTPKHKQPIYNSLANANVNADYKFTFIVENFLPSGGRLEVVFPYQYAVGLGISNVDSNTCSLPCTVVKRTVTFTFNFDIYNGTGMINL